MPAGRPTDYSTALATKAWDYLDTYESKYKDVIPSVVGLADALKCSDTTLYNWDTEDKPEFFGILAAIKQKQLQVLMNKGLDGSFSAPITKLVMGKHGFHDKQDTDNRTELSVTITKFTEQAP